MKIVKNSLEFEGMFKKYYIFSREMGLIFLKATEVICQFLFPDISTQYCTHYAAIVASTKL